LRARAPRVVVALLGLRQPLVLERTEAAGHAVDRHTGPHAHRELGAGGPHPCLHVWRHRDARLARVEKPMQERDGEGGAVEDQLERRPARLLLAALPILRDLLLHVGFLLRTRPPASSTSTCAAVLREGARARAVSTLGEGQLTLTSGRPT